MEHAVAGDSLLASLQPDFRRDVEASAASIVHRLASATASRLQRLAALAKHEGLSAESPEAATTAFALAAELERRARLLHH